ncbi:Protein of unknown function [Bacillus wiedmannii]|nr:Protein of unknown function [Bacillus wiedmannii]
MGGTWYVMYVQL